MRRPATPLEGPTVDIVIEAENPDLALRPAMEAPARIELDEGKSPLRVPDPPLQRHQQLQP